MRKIIIYIILAILVLGGGFTIYYKFFRSKQVVVSESLRAIPTDASLVIEIRDIGSLKSMMETESEFWSHLQQLEGTSKVHQFITYLDSLKTANPLATQVLENTSVLISFHTIGKSKLETLCLINLSSEINQEDVIELFKNEMLSKASIMERTYDDVPMFDARYNKGKLNLCFAIYQQNLLFSYSSMLVEDAIRQLKYSDKSIADDAAFMEVYQTAGQKEVANVFVQYNLLPELINPFLSEKYHKFSAYLKSWSTWSELDMNTDENSIKLNGFSNCNDSLPNFVNVLASQKALESDIEKIIPSQTSMYIYMALNDHKVFQTKIDAYMQSVGCYGKANEILTRVENQTGQNIRELFYPLIDDEVGMAITEINALDVFQNAFLIIKTKSKSASEEALRTSLSEYALKSNKNLNQLITQTYIDASAKFDIYELPFQDMGQVLFGPWFSAVKTNYLVFYNNYMIIGSNKEALSRYIHALLLNKTLGTDIRHNSFISDFSDKSNMFLYFNTFRAKELFKQWMPTDFANSFELNFEDWSALSQIGIQLTQGDDMMYNYCVVRFEDGFKNEPKTVWTSKLDAPVTTKPLLVRNHTNDSKEILVQDANNTLYLITNSGRELWKIPIDEPVIGDVFQVDTYKNNKLQYLFVTKTQLHLIDRLGNYVDNYPVPLRSEASAGIGLFDYDNNLKYRILIPCSDKNAYMYDIDGKVIKGWEYQGSEHIVNTPPYHFRIANKDYIVLHDKHKMYILNRTGEARTSTKAMFNFSDNPVYCDKPSESENSRVFCTNNNGKIIYQYFDGRTDSLQLNEFGGSHHFSACDIDSDGYNEYFIVKGKKLIAFNKDGDKIFTYEFPDEIDGAVHFYLFPRNQIKIGVVCSNAGLIYLMNDNGSVFQGFPLNGISDFSIGYLYNNSESFNLVVAGKENLLYNYEVKE